jgi:hypothetical protein
MNIANREITGILGMPPFANRAFISADYKAVNHRRQ